MEKEIDLLVEAARNNRLLIFAGAGISVGSENAPGLPTGSEMNDLLKAAFDEQKVLGDLPLDQAAEYLEYKYGRAALIKKLSEIIESVAIPTPTHDLIAELPFEVFVTTNYDNLMEAALERRKRPYQLITGDLDLAGLSSNRVKVFKIHGCISKNKERIILTEFDYYSKFLVQKQVFRDVLKAWLLTHTCLFIGYSLNDVNLKNLFFDISLNMGVKNVKERYYSVQKDPSSAQIRLWKERGFSILAADQYVFLDKLVEAIEFGAFEKQEGVLTSSGGVKVGKMSIDEIRGFEKLNGKHEQRMALLSRRKMNHLGLVDGDWLYIELNGNCLLVRAFLKESTSFTDIKLPLVVRNLLSFSMKKHEVNSLVLKKHVPLPIRELHVKTSDFITIMPVEYDIDQDQRSLVSIRTLEYELLELNKDSTVIISSPSKPEMRIKAKVSLFHSNPGRAMVGLNGTLKDAISSHLSGKYDLTISKV